MLKIVVEAKFPVGNVKVPPSPTCVEPTTVVPILSEYVTPTSERATVIDVAVPSQIGVLVAAVVRLISGCGFKGIDN